MVTQSDTAQTCGSGDVPVLSTSRVLALVEAASVSALTRRMPTRFTSLGGRVELRHLAPAPLGARVTARAVLERRTGNRLWFTVTVHDDNQRLLADGRLLRVVIDREEFLAELRDTVPAGSPEPPTAEPSSTEPPPVTIETVRIWSD